MYKILIALFVFLIALIIPYFLTNNTTKEGLSRSRKKKRRRRAEHRRKWFAWSGDGWYNTSKGGYKGYLNELPQAYRENYDADYLQIKLQNEERFIKNCFSGFI